MENNLIIVGTFELPSEMYVIRSRLESAGIHCFVQDELTVQVHNFYSNAIGGVKLQIRKADLEKAMPHLVAAGLIKKPSENNEPTLWNKLDEMTSKIPVLSSAIFEVRIIIIALLIALLVVIPLAILS
jgi:hypothetical protein